MVTSADFWEKAAAKYIASPMKDPATYEAWLTRVTAHITTGDHVLELGAGSGGTALRLAAHAAHVTATDIAPTMVANGKAEAARQGVENTTFLQAVLGDAAIQGPYDAIAAFNVIHLMEQPEKALKQIHAALKPGGIFLSKTATIGRFSPLRLAIGILKLFGKAPHVNFWSRAELEEKVRAAGFEILEADQYPKKGLTRLIIARKT